MSLEGAASQDTVRLEVIGEGTGIGLYQCRRLVEGAGGNLYIASAPGQGTTITSRCAAPQRFRQPALDAGPAM